MNPSWPMVGRPYPPTGLSTALWATLRPQPVLLTQLVATQPYLYWDALLAPDNGHTGDPFPNIVRWRGTDYLEDGHHRVIKRILRGSAHMLARVHEI